ncbi:hypothetical protein WJX72_012545 [[Myrmecia] bisecta]|uniref:Uncharacterized protein n=1 Tax=[Myrmecia] bisecta TaxID=41462 RepID=A0AAW1PMH4_9CHLO
MDSDSNCINCWSGPRCVSTSLMYSFAQRSDTQVLDEPLYASFLRVTGAERPYRDQVLAEQENDGNKVVTELLLAPRKSKVLYVKHMAKHRVGLGKALLKGAAHMLLVREPYKVVLSFAEVLEPTLHETCYPALCELYSDLRVLGRPPPVVMSDDLVKNPEGVLRALCLALHLDFDPAMLEWPAGPRPEDGCWAPWWYAATHRSTGFASRGTAETLKPMPDRLKPLLSECQPLYEMLRAHALQPLPPESWQVQRPLSNGAASASDRAGDSADGPGQEAGPVDGVSGVQTSHGSVSLPGDMQRQRHGTHAYEDDERNANILIGMRDGVSGAFHQVWRPAAKVSVFDSGFMLGDGVWEGIRLHQGVLVFADAHLDRLYEGAKAIDMDLGVSKEQLRSMIYETIDANGMAGDSGMHIRLMVTRGLKATPYQNPNITIGLPTIIIIPEYKRAAQGPKETGIQLFTCHVRRGAPDVQDPGWNSHSKLNCIAACIQAAKAGADEALMLDPHGFVATCNSVNFFCVRKGVVWAPTTKYQLHGITRANVIRLCKEHGIPARELDFSLTQVYSAEEAFVTGTFGGQTPVTSVDGRMIGDGKRGPITARLQQLYEDLMHQKAAQGR